MAKPRTSRPEGQRPPAELAERRIWVLWKLEHTKVPYQARRPNAKASTTDPSTWSTFEEAWNARDKADGIGFVISKRDGILGIDLDDCVNGNGLHEDAQRIVDTCASYTEWSPSGKGVHVALFGECPTNKHKLDAPWGGKFEIYDNDRFFTWTGNALAGAPTALASDRQDQIAEFYEPIEQWHLDTGVLKNVLKKESVMLLFEGETADQYGDGRSDADHALAKELARKTRDPEQILRLMWRSGLAREKWERQDYLPRTIDRALQEVEADRSERSSLWSWDRDEDVQRQLYILEVRDEARRQHRANQTAHEEGRRVEGGEFIFDHIPDQTALWGEGETILWAKGEPFMLTGPQSVGKTTLMHQVMGRRIGVLSGKLLGFTIPRAEGKVLLIAADRPNQIARCLRRVVQPRMQDALNERLVIWKGPPPFDLGTCESGTFAQWIADLDDEISDVYVDSMKDVAVGLSDDKVGSNINREYQTAISAGYDLFTDHHHRKAQGDNKRPTKLDDVYGSTWLTSGHGSVALLWGQPGDTFVEIVHLKPPAEPFGPFELRLDRTRGTMELVTRKTDLIELVSEYGSTGASAKEIAQRLHGPNVSKEQIESVRNKLKRLQGNEALSDVGEGRNKRFAV